MRIVTMPGFLAGAGCAMLLAATPVLPQRHSNAPRARRARRIAASDSYEFLKAEVSLRRRQRQLSADGKSTSKSKDGKSTSKSKAGKSTSKSKAGKSTSKSKAGKSTSKSKAGKSSREVSMSMSLSMPQTSKSTSKSKAGKSSREVSTSMSLSTLQTSKSTSKSKAGKSSREVSMSMSLSTSQTSKSTSKSKAGKSTSESKASKSTSKSEAGKSTSKSEAGKSTSKSEAGKSTSKSKTGKSKSKAGKSTNNNNSRSRRCEESTSLPWQSEIKRGLRGKSRRRPRGKSKRRPRESESESEKSGKDRCREISAAPSLSSSPSEQPSSPPSDGIEVSLSISPEDPDVIDGGVPGRLYFFDLLAENLPAGLGEVRFEWSGLGAADARTASVTSDGEATTRIGLSNAVPGPYTVAAKVFDGPAELATAALDVRIAGTALAIDPPGLTGGATNTPYDFEFVATDVPAGIESVTINWSFGTGNSGVGQASVPVEDGQAIASATHTYSSEGAFRLTAAVRDGGLVLADNSVTVTVGAVTSRNLTLGSCGAFSPSNSGNEGTTVDLWDVSAISPGAEFDIEFDARSIPDRFIVEYPVGNEVLDTGWRGSSSFNGDPKYPGGVAGFGTGFVNDMFRRLTPSEFQVTIFGPDAGTFWSYEIRCRVAGAAADLGPIQTEPWVEEMSQEEVEAAIEEETALAAALKEDDEDDTPALEEEKATGDVLKARCPWC